jgi:hypothetical protein
VRLVGIRGPLARWRTPLTPPSSVRFDLADVPIASARTCVMSPSVTVVCGRGFRS